MLTIQCIITHSLKVLDVLIQMYQRTIFRLKLLFETMGGRKRHASITRADEKYHDSKRRRNHQDSRDSSSHRQSRRHSSSSSSGSRQDIKHKFHDFEDAWYYTKHKTPQFNVVEEIVQDLFTVDKEYALAHCVAADLRMGAGIAVAFKKIFGQVKILRQQDQDKGGCAYLRVDGRLIYYLVTKEYSKGKPTYLTLFQSLSRMKSLMREHRVKLLAVPCLGCGLDRLQWDKVKFMLEYIFRHTDVKITVCLLEEPAKPQKWQKNYYKEKQSYKTK